MRSLIFLAIFAMSSIAHAQFLVDDAKSVFANIKKSSRTALLDFDKAMPCGEKVGFTANHSRCEYRCSTSFCQSRCEVAMGFEAKFDLHIDECSAEKVNVFGDNGLSLEITRDDLVKDGTWIRPLLVGAGHFVQPQGHWELRGLSPASASRVVGGKVVPIPNVVQLELGLTFGTPGAMGEFYFALIDLDQAGLGQVLAFGEGLFATPESTVFLQQRGVILPKSPGGLFP